MQTNLSHSPSFSHRINCDLKKSSSKLNSRHRRLLTLNFYMSSKRDSKRKLGFSESEIGGGRDVRRVEVTVAIGGRRYVLCVILSYI
ncbi:unnamed protein product [Lactuca virosa]|uniref:Uncharacterized protein n=1 Tax=Lactuca virosa TaxID=75947 RepID=A0AAU9PWZ4_9ASTR|nr:unnamed protein product [Lactuca virosa]